MKNIRQAVVNLQFAMSDYFSQPTDKQAERAYESAVDAANKVFEAREVDLSTLLADDSHHELARVYTEGPIIITHAGKPLFYFAAAEGHPTTAEMMALVNLAIGVDK